MRSANYNKYAKKHKEWVCLNIENWLRVKLISINTNQRNRRRNITIDITVNNLIDTFKKQNGKCALTNVAMTHEPGLKAASVDRIDSNGGYTRDNIQLVCKAINLGKNTHSNDDIKSFIEDVLSASRSNSVKIQVALENKNGRT